MNDKIYGLFIIDDFYDGKSERGWLSITGDQLGKNQLYPPYQMIKGYPSRAKAKAAKERIESGGVRMLHGQYSQEIRVRKVPDELAELATLKEWD